MDEPYVTKTGRVLADADVEAFAAGDERRRLRDELARAMDFFEWCWDCGATVQDCRDADAGCCPDCRHRDAADARILVD